MKERCPPEPDGLGEEPHANPTLDCTLANAELVCELGLAGEFSEQNFLWCGIGIALQRIPPLTLVCETANLGAVGWDTLGVSREEKRRGNCR